MRKIKGLKLDPGALKRFHAAAKKSAKAAQYWQGGYLRNAIRDKYKRRTRRSSIKGEKDNRASSPGQAPFTWAIKRSKTKKGVTKIRKHYPLRDVRFSLIGDTGVIAGVWFYKRAKGSTAATVPALHEHSGSATIQSMKYYVIQEGKPRKEIYGSRNTGLYNRRSDRVSSGSRRAFGKMIADGKAKVVSSPGKSRKVFYPKRPAVKPAGMSASRSVKMGKTFHIMRRKTKQYYKAKGNKP